MSPPDKAQTSKSSTARSGGLFALGTLVSRISGVAREAVVGAVFGAGTAMDAFVVAYRIPNLLRELVAEGALGSSFTQVYTKTAERSETEARQVLVNTLKITAILGVALAIAGVLLAPWLVDLMSQRSPAGDSAQFTRIAVRQTQILFPTIAIFAVTSVISGALHKKGLFFLSAVSPAMFNLANILGALAISPLIVAIASPDFATWLGDAAITGLSLGVLLGASLQMLLALTGLWRELNNLRSGPRRPFLAWDSATRRIFTLMGPMVIAASAGQVNVIVNTNFATSLEPGAVTWLNFAFRFLQLPVGIFGVAISSAVLPALTRAIAKAGNKIDGRVSDEIMNGLELVAWLMVPSFVLFQVASPEIIRFFYQAGKFTAKDTEATAVALSAYSFSLLGYGFLKVLNSYYYATERTRFAMWVGLLSIAVNFIGNYFLVAKYGHRGLALTASVTLTGNATLLLIGLKRDRIKFDTKRILGSTALLSLSVAGALSLVRLTETAWPFMWSGLPLGYKAAALVTLIGKGLLIISVFAASTMLRLRSSPVQLWRKLRQGR